MAQRVDREIVDKFLKGRRSYIPLEAKKILKQNRLFYQKKLTRLQMRKAIDKLKEAGYVPAYKKTLTEVAKAFREQDRIEKKEISKTEKTALKHKFIKEGVMEDVANEALKEAANPVLDQENRALGEKGNRGKETDRDRIREQMGQEAALREKWANIQKKWAAPEQFKKVKDTAPHIEQKQPLPDIFAGSD